MPHITDEQYTQAVKAGIIKPESAWYEPKEGEQYWYLIGGRVSLAIFHDDNMDKAILSHQQIFRTKKEAEHEEAKRIALTTIKRWCALNAPFTPDWKDVEQGKWYVGYNNAFKPCSDYLYKCIPTIPYLASKEHAEQLISLFDKELRIIFEIE